MSFTTQKLKKKSTKPVLTLVFINNIHFLDNTLGNLVKNLVEKSQEFNGNVLNLLKKNRFFPYLDSLEKLKEGLPTKYAFYNTMTNCIIIDKNYKYVLKHNNGLS